MFGLTVVMKHEIRTIITGSSSSSLLLNLLITACLLLKLKLINNAVMFSVSVLK